MNIVIDIGNTRYKAAVFEEEQLVESIESKDWEAVTALCCRYACQYALLSSVRKPEANLLEALQGVLSSPLLLLSHQTPVPLQNLYHTPETLGMDRLAAVVGAQGLYPQHNCLVIDAGTCITYDLVDAQGRYQGGLISPGVALRLQAMHHFTQKLPLLPWEASQALPALEGKSTAEAMQGGAVRGTIQEMEGLIGSFAIQYPDLKVLICGGDTFFFESMIKQPIFAVQKLVLFGLNRILRYNVSQKN